MAPHASCRPFRRWAGTVALPRAAGCATCNASMLVVSAGSSTLSRGKPAHLHDTIHRRLPMLLMRYRGVPRDMVPCTCAAAALVFQINGTAPRQRPVLKPLDVLPTASPAAPLDAVNKRLSLREAPVKQRSRGGHSGLRCMCLLTMYDDVGTI